LLAAFGKEKKNHFSPSKQREEKEGLLMNKTFVTFLLFSLSVSGSIKSTRRLAKEKG